MTGIMPKDAEPATRAANTAVRAALPFEDRRDFADARRGLIAELPEGIVRAASGNVVWNLRDYDFLDAEEAPATVNPSLWRMARLNRVGGLFHVTDRVYQLRSIDIANMTIVEGDSGIVVIDTLMTCDIARAGLELYYAHRPRRPIVAVIYTHSHIDHFGGVKGIIAADDAAAGRVAVIAPDGFMEAVGGENVLAGLAMARRAQYQFGTLLPAGERQHVDAGIGKGFARGVQSLIAPTDLIKQPIETRTLDGIDFVFHLAPETEAPAEMHIHLPQLRVLDMAENATRHLHNFIPLRGAVARDPRMWSHYLAEAIDLFGAETDILIGQHHWPTWGQSNVLAFLAKQRDLYKFIHDQALRLANKGLRPAEISEALDLPPDLAREWSVRGYYGTVRHNAKAVYQRYLSWYDGNPANLNPLPPADAARKTIAYMGGADAVLARARADFAKGEYRWVAEIAGRLVFAEPDNRAARDLAADAFEQLGYQAESATWRNAYLYGAQELRDGVATLPPRLPLSPDLVSGLDLAILFDYLAIRLDPERAAGQRLRIDWTVGDTGERAALNLENSTLTCRTGKTSANP
ncbi:MAG TPA: alkyl sulfatase dimerization domain-containing protein, partial [Stellaceae bacterium]|nr:alkyl sulfatase dimerization domain-containing protein [Stellaceae bacterium]